MITLQKMNKEEFRTFKEFSISDYAMDLMNGQNLSREQALNDAEEEFDGDLPDGLETKDSFVMNIVDANENRVGWIWFQYYSNEDDNIKWVFLEDLLIVESERRKGYASAAIEEMNVLAKKDGCTLSELFVWYHNPGGVSLYEKLGYKPFDPGKGGTYMRKVL